MPTLKAPVTSELDIKKSRFIALIEPVRDRKAAQDRLHQLRQQYPDARHLCFAFYAGGDSGMSDDGEPSGTAGKPIFNVLQHKRLENVLAVVVRYFGGIKLGAGGLARAYSGAVSKALEQAEFETIEAQIELQLYFPFSLESQVRWLLDEYALPVNEPVYNEQVHIAVRLAERNKTDFVRDFHALAPADKRLKSTD